MSREYSHTVNLDDDKDDEIEVPVNPKIADLEDEELEAEEGDSKTQWQPPPEPEPDDEPELSRPDPRVSELEEELARVKQFLNADYASRMKGSREQEDAALDQRIALTKAKLKKAHEEGNTDAVLEATDELTDLKVERKARSYAPPEPAPVAQAAPRQPAPIPLAAKWKSANSWFDSPEYQEETLLARGIDARMAGEGWSPEKPGYYVELNKRIAAKVRSVKPVDIVPRPKSSPPPTAAPRAPAASRPGTVKLGQSDYQVMRMTGLDPNNADHRKAYARQKVEYGE